MHIDKARLAESPYIGVFGLLTDNILLVPPNRLKKEQKKLRTLVEADILPCTLASSSLLGALGVAVDTRIAFSEQVEQREIDILEEAGLKTCRVPGVTAVGNLVSANAQGGVCSADLSEETRTLLSEFFNIPIARARIGGSELVGSCLVACKNGFITTPRATEDDFACLTKWLGVNGTRTTANYGDQFVGNSVLANKDTILVGANTTNHEIIRIEEGLSGATLKQEARA